MNKRLLSLFLCLLVAVAAFVYFLSESKITLTSPSIDSRPANSPFENGVLDNSIIENPSSAATARKLKEKQQKVASMLLKRQQKLSNADLTSTLTEEELANYESQSKALEQEIEAELARLDSGSLTGKQKIVLKRRIKILTEQYNQVVLPLAIHKIQLQPNSG